MTDTHERLIAILMRSHKLTPERLGLDAPLQGLGIDSLATIELLWDIEDRFQVKLPADPTGLVTVGDVVMQIDAALRPQPQVLIETGAVAAVGTATP